MDKECRDLLKKEQRTPKKPKKHIQSTLGDDPIHGQDDNEVEEEDKENYDNQTTKNNTRKSRSKKLFESETNSTSTSHPVYKEISLKNGFINRQDLSTLKRICKTECIDSSGKRDLLMKRLKQYYKVKMLQDAGLMVKVNRSFDFLVVIDFEATCEDKSGDYPHEIIEFPAVLIDVSKSEIISSWRRYVKPVINPELSEFCVTLTGISQELVDGADEFPVVLNQFEDWLSQNRLGVEKTFGLVTDGPFDVGRFLRLSCEQHAIAVPSWASRWINIRKAFGNYYRTGKGNGYKGPGLQCMLSRLDLQFQGNPHCGLDDATNIARVVKCLLRDGAALRVNERLDSGESRAAKERRLRQVAHLTRQESEDWLARCKKSIEMNRKEVEHVDSANST